MFTVVYRVWYLMLLHDALLIRSPSKTTIKYCHGCFAQMSQQPWAWNKHCFTDLYSSCTS